MAAVIDGYNPQLGGWVAWYYAGVIATNNHARLKGENVVFVDGHGEWRTSATIQKRS